jgi:hypothetical protein
VSQEDPALLSLIVDRDRHAVSSPKYLVEYASRLLQWLDYFVLGKGEDPIPAMRSLFDCFAMNSIVASCIADIVAIAKPTGRPRSAPRDPNSLKVLSIDKARSAALPCSRSRFPGTLIDELHPVEMIPYGAIGPSATPNYNLCCEPNQFQSERQTSKFGWLQAIATKVSSLLITSANPATIRIVDFCFLLCKDIENPSSYSEFKADAPAKIISGVPATPDQCRDALTIGCERGLFYEHPLHRPGGVRSGLRVSIVVACGASLWRS